MREAVCLFVKWCVNLGTNELRRSQSPPYFHHEIQKQEKGKSVTEISNDFIWLKPAFGRDFFPPKRFSRLACVIRVLLKSYFYAGYIVG